MENIILATIVTVLFFIAGYSFYRAVKGFTNIITIRNKLKKEKYLEEDTLCF